MYYWHILHLDHSELLYKFYKAQKLKPSKNEWVTQDEKDKKDLQLDLDDEEVMKMSQLKFKHIIQNKMRDFVAKCLQAIQSKQSKTSQLKINNQFKPADYLFSQNLCKDEIQTLFKLRSRTIDVKQNMESSNKNMLWCRTCFLYPETQKHIFHCADIRTNVEYQNFEGLDYDMIYGGIDNQEKFVKVYYLMLQARQNMLDKR